MGDEEEVPVFDPTAKKKKKKVSLRSPCDCERRGAYETPTV